MQNEILKPVLATDETAIPRYDIVNPDGSVAQQNVELRLKNEVMQQGTPYDEESVLPATLREKLGLPNSATPADAFEAVVAKAGAKVSMNEPTSQDNIAAGYSIGAFWLRPSFELLNTTYDINTDAFVANACSISKSNHTITLTGNGDDKVISATTNLSVTDGWIYATIKINKATSARVVCGSASTSLTIGIGNTNVVCMQYTGAQLLIEATYSTANDASSGIVTIENLTVIDRATAMLSGEYAGADLNVGTVLRCCQIEAPFRSCAPATMLWQQVRDGIWDIISGISDTVRTIYECTYAGTVDTVLQFLRIPTGKYGFHITLKLTDGTPVRHANITGVTDLYGNAVYTDDNGVIPIAIADSSTPTLSCSNYVGIADFEWQVQAEHGVPFTPVVKEVDYDESMRLFQSSGTLTVLPGIPLDVCLVSGGGGGGGDNYSGGKGGGVVNNYDIVLKTPTSLKVAIGGGGNFNSNSGGIYTSGNLGGNSVLYIDGETFLTAPNNTGVNGGRSGANGSNGTTYVFDDTSLPRPGGGGAGRGASGGADFGGSSSQTSSGGSGTGPGGGGGMGAGNRYSPGRGASGGLYIRINLSRR